MRRFAREAAWFLVALVLVLGARQCSRVVWGRYYAGQERERCYQNWSCDRGLTCASFRCVKLPTTVSE